jgi:predicted nucleotide-binding protein
LLSKIESNQYLVLKFIYDVEENLKHNTSFSVEMISKETGLSVMHTREALRILYNRHLIDASGRTSIDGKFEILSVESTPEGKLMAEELTLKKEKEEKKFLVHGSRNKRSVFVIHGRDLDIRNSIFEFLRSLDLHPLEWSELIKSTGSGAPYVGEVLDKAFSEAQAIVVLMTPDDEGCLREHLRGTNEPSHEKELTPQPRLNVIFEAGIAMGRRPDRTIIVEVGSVRPFSDIAGRHSVRLDDSAEKRLELAQRLETAGCLVNMKGTSWLKAGKFSKTPDVLTWTIE